MEKIQKHRTTDELSSKSKYGPKKIKIENESRERGLELDSKSRPVFTVQPDSLVKMVWMFNHLYSGHLWQLQALTLKLWIPL